MPWEIRTQTPSRVLETDRLVLRRHRLDDFPHAARMWGDPAVTRHVGGRPFTDGRGLGRA